MTASTHTDIRFLFNAVAQSHFSLQTVPTMVFDGKLAVVGAQPVEALRAAVAQAAG